MSYDFDGLDNRDPPTVTGYKPWPHDLETICVLIDLAAINLTPTAGTIFTYDQLLAQMREMAGDEFEVDEVDVKVVLPLFPHLKKEPGGYSLR